MSIAFIGADRLTRTHAVAFQLAGRKGGLNAQLLFRAEVAIGF